jgi:hypothetical protein
VASGAHRTGVNLEARLAELERDLELAHTELANLEDEHARYHAALRRIAEGPPGRQARLAHDALHPAEVEA